MKVLIIDDDERQISEYIEKFNQYDKNIFYRQTITVKGALEILKEDKSYDLVLLDIVDMDMQPELAIDKIKELLPYIPIVMLSIQMTSEVIIECIDRGAKSYILKSHLDASPDCLMLTEGRRRAIETEWKECVDKIRKFAEEYQPIKRRLYGTREIGWFKKRGRVDRSIIKDQIEYLENIQLKMNVREYFPEIRDYGEISHEVDKEVEWWQYEIPHYNLLSLKKVIFRKRNIDDYEKKLIEKAISEILRIVFTKLYVFDETKVIDPNRFLNETYYEKYEKRKQEVREIIKDSSRIGEIALDALLCAKKIYIGKKEFRNPEDILNELRSDRDFNQLMVPPKICLIHGDLHFDNILIDLDFPEHIYIKFIDPRGFRNPQDIAYDLGKLLHSTNGEYDFIHEGYLKTNISFFRREKDDTVFFGPLNFDVWVEKQMREGGSRDITISHVSEITESHQPLYRELKEFILEEIEKKGYLQDDESWKLRAYFNEAMHFCTMLPFHVKKDMIRTISIYLRGVELINKFYDDYIAPLKK